MQRVPKGDFLHFRMPIGSNYDVREVAHYVNLGKNAKLTFHFALQHLTTEDYCVGALSEARKYS